MPSVKISAPYQEIRNKLRSAMMMPSKLPVELVIDTVIEDFIKDIRPVNVRTMKDLVNDFTGIFDSNVPRSKYTPIFIGTKTFDTVSEMVRFKLEHADYLFIQEI
jgi:hypothetical protein